MLECHGSQDESDVVFRVAPGKWRAVVSEINRMYRAGRPVLIGTTSVEQSEALGKQLDEVQIPYQVLRTRQCILGTCLPLSVIIC
jgi:preprotein translocase subunit SecA